MVRELDQPFPDGVESVQGTPLHFLLAAFVRGGDGGNRGPGRLDLPLSYRNVRFHLGQERDQPSLGPNRAGAVAARVESDQRQVGQHIERFPHLAGRDAQIVGQTSNVQVRPLEHGPIDRLVLR